MDEHHPGPDVAASRRLGGPTQTEQDLAASLRETAGALRDAEQQVADARRYVAGRVADLDRQAASYLAEATRAIAQQRPRIAAAQLQQHAETQDTMRELRRMLDLL